MRVPLVEGSKMERAMQAASTCSEDQDRTSADEGGEGEEAFTCWCGCRRESQEGAGRRCVWCQLETGGLHQDVQSSGHLPHLRKMVVLDGSREPQRRGDGVTVWSAGEVGGGASRRCRRTGETGILGPMGTITWRQKSVNELC